jgi:ribA/ribD-fused uncharacterized protein
MIKECWEKTCGNKCPWYNPYTPRGVRKVVLPDGHTGPVFCSYECGAYYGIGGIKKWNIIPFYGHTKLYGFLSNWYSSPIDFAGWIYNNVEQFTMAYKATMFYDEETFRKIMKAKHPKQYKALGREVRNYNEESWSLNRFNIVKQGIRLKFEQNPLLKEQLLKTGGQLLVEASPTDAIWGIALAIDDPNVMYPHLWKGKNLLGNALMEVRHEFLLA